MSILRLFFIFASLLGNHQVLHANGGGVGATGTTEDDDELMRRKPVAGGTPTFDERKLHSEASASSTDNNGSGSDCPFSQIFSYLTLNLCMVATTTTEDHQGSKNEVRLGYDCSAICPPTPENGYSMRLEGTQLCLQASHGGGGSQLRDGNKMRVKPCNPAEEELQQFVWVDDADPRPLKLLSSNYNHLCATNRGVNARPGDPIIFKACDSLQHPEERQFWWGD